MPVRLYVTGPRGAPVIAPVIAPMTAPLTAPVAALLAVFFAALIAAPAVAQDKAADRMARAKALAQSALIVDGHIDVPYRVIASGEDVGQKTEGGDFDFYRAQAGGLDAPFMSIYVSALYQDTGGAKAQADRLIGLVEGLAARHPSKFEIATSVADVRRIAGEGKIALPLGMENGAPIEGWLGNLEHFYRRGIRYITLTHSKANHIADSSYDPEKRWGGLSPFGALVVRRMNALGILVDISHVSDAAFFDVMAIAQAPAIASHSSARAFTPGFERNMSDEMIQALASNDGVIMINFGSAFLTEAANRWRDEVQQAYAAHQREKGAQALSADAFESVYKEEHPYPYATVGDVADHIDHVRDLVGVRHIGLGSDYDGVGDTLPVGLKDASAYPVLIAELFARGYAEDEIVGILGENLLRVWREVERVAAKHRR